ncbi:transcriptional regulator [Flavobacterium sp. 316]|uniref:YqgE/AlgH family protein n=1 Tax=Flavobacterium sediminilitoris TaxID=2024526 RepID=A0ABY4HHL1_9FLAO|nr:MULTISPECIES: YqgE/AlgH family protein [Flavobacterium]KIX22083.1 transcriptional regulator [Flavobacterium sp. 316]UOX32325.1 YqgE/AlgH family protein [Flavobacterium sediminilitoris]
MISVLPKKGHLLIAEPSTIGDLSFNRSVVLLAEHNNEGSVGFILNKPLNYSINDLVPEIEAVFKVYNGGPVEQDNLYFIHNVPNIIPNSIEIANGIYWGGDFETTKTLINNGEISKNNIRFFLGYSGWETNQLEKELKENSWIIAENKLKSKLLSKSSQHFWKEKIIEQGGEYVLFSNAPSDPMLN